MRVFPSATHARRAVRAACAILSLLAAAAGAQAFQGEESPNPPAPFQSTLSRAQVQAQARDAQPIGNGSTGVLRPTDPRTDRAAVRAGAAAAARRGSAFYGERGMPM